MPVNKWTLESLKTFKFYFAGFQELNDPCELNMRGKTDIERNRILYQYNDPKEPNGIFCLSKRPDNLQMWAQYAIGHHGIVVEFETDNDKDFFDQLMEVEYCKDPPLFAEITQVKDHAGVKSLDSEKEEEFRVFGFKGLKEIKKEAVTSIFLGYRWPWETIYSRVDDENLSMTVRQNHLSYKELSSLYLYNKLPNHINFYETKIDRESYSMGFQIMEKTQLTAHL